MALFSINPPWDAAKWFVGEQWLIIERERPRRMAAAGGQQPRVLLYPRAQLRRVGLNPPELQEDLVHLDQQH